MRTWTGGWSTLQREDLAVVAKGALGRHDEGLRIGTGMATAFCNAIEGLFESKTGLTVLSLARVVCDLFSADARWSTGYIVFTVLLRQGGVWKVFNCGTNIVFSWSVEGMEMVVRPQSVAEEVRSRGESEPPSYIEVIVVKAATCECKAEDIREATVDSSRIVAFGDYRVADAVQREVHDTMMSRAELDELVCRVAETLINPQKAYVMLTGEGKE